MIRRKPFSDRCAFAMEALECRLQLSVAGIGLGDSIAFNAGETQFAAAARVNPDIFSQAPTINSLSETRFTVGTAGAFTVTTNNGTNVTLSETGSLPAGITFTDNHNGTATIGGTALAGSGNNYMLTITAADGTPPNAIQSFFLTVDEAPAITSRAAATFVANSAGTFTVTSSGFPSPAISEVGTLPDGVTFTANSDGTATISGTPTVGGTFPIAISAQNGPSNAATQMFTLTVDQAPTITSAAGATFSSGTAGAFTITSTAFPIATLMETGSLPAGMTFAANSDGTATISGTPAAGGTFPISVSAANGVSPSATQMFTLTVDQSPAFTSLAATTFDVGTAGSFTITTTGTPAATISEPNTLPPGFFFKDNGDGTATLSGTPLAEAEGQHALIFIAKNGTKPNARQTLVLNVDDAPSFTSADDDTFMVKTLSTFTITTTGFPVAAIVNMSTLPAGLSFLDNGNGTATLSGTPIAGTTGVYPLNFVAKSASKPNAHLAFTLTIARAPSFTSAATAAFAAGTAGSFTITTNGFPLVSLAETGTLPPGLTFHDNLNGTATISGTPQSSVAGSFDIALTGRNSIKPAAKQTLTVTVEHAPAFSNAAAATFTVGSQGTFSFTTTGFPAATLSLSGALPAGISFLDQPDGSAMLLGTPLKGQRGTYVLTLTAKNGDKPNAKQTFTLTVVK